VGFEIKQQRLFRYSQEGIEGQAGQQK